jgi:hypothetical protein
MRSEDFTVRKTVTLSALAVAAALTIAPTAAHAQPMPPPPPPAPPGYEPMAPPPYAQPAQQGYYVPPSVAASGPRRITDWEEGEPIPPGYHPVSRIRKGLVIGGAITFGTIYLTNVLTAAIASDTCNAVGGCSGTGNNLAALYVPVIGPFIQMGSTHSATGNFFLVMDGLLQAGGVAMFVAGLAAPKVVLVRNDLAKAPPKLQITPIPLSFGKDGGGLGFVGAF